MNAELATVFIIEGELEACASLGVILEAAGLGTESYRSAEEFLDSFDPNRHSNGQDCALVDVLLPGMTGLELQENLRVNQINLPIVFLTGERNISQCVQAMKAGAVNVLEKPCPKLNLLQSVSEALTQHEQMQQVSLERETVKRRLATLTRREREILAQLVSGEPNISSGQIAERLYISRRTVEHHRAAIKEKMHARSLLELVDMAKAGGFRL